MKTEPTVEETPELKATKELKDNLGYLKDTFAELKIKELEYVRTLLDSTLSEKRARFRLNKKQLVSNGSLPAPKSDDAWEKRQEAEDDYI